MNTPDDESADDLTRAYRSASDADAGTPAAATRAAILAAARAAALQRTPAANDSRYVWRAAAGIAVLGVAVILWRQTDRRLTPNLDVAAPESATAVAESPAAVAQPDAGAAAADRAANRPPAKSASRDERQDQLKAAPARAREEASGSVAATPEAAAATVQLARASATASAVAPVPPVAPSQSAGAIRKDSPDYQQLVRREFPEVWNSTDALPTLWVVLDARGAVLRKGSMPPGAAITADQPFESQRPWTITSVKTASGRIVQLAVMTLN